MSYFSHLNVTSEIHRRGLTYGKLPPGGNSEFEKITLIQVMKVRL